MKANLIILLLSVSSFAYCQSKNNDYLIRFFEKPDPEIGANQLGDKCGYMNTKGDTVIPFGKYYFCYADTFRTYAIVLKNKGGCAGIDRNENEMYEVYWFDNGPDYTSEGFFRIKKNEKIGFAESASGKIVIPPQFDFVVPFKEGMAAFNIGCTFQKDGHEHSAVTGGKWGFINKKGDVVIPAQYDTGKDFENGKAKVYLNGKEYIIDKQGKVLENKQ